MKKFFYEILEQINSNPKDVKNIIKENNTPYLRHLLKLTFDPTIEFYPKKFPKEYKEPDTAPGISISDLQSEIKRLYLFQKGNEIADKLSEEKRTILLIQMLESFEPKEAQVLINVFNKNLKTKGLNAKVVKELFPDLLP